MLMHLKWCCSHSSFVLIYTQHHIIRMVPVTQCFCQLKEKGMKYFVYGLESRVHAPEYPDKCCWGCTILWWIFRECSPSPSFQYLRLRLINECYLYAQFIISIFDMKHFWEFNIWPIGVSIFAFVGGIGIIQTTCTFQRIHIKQKRGPSIWKHIWNIMVGGGGSREFSKAF